jgi:hypothetical protein
MQKAGTSFPVSKKNSNTIIFYQSIPGKKHKIENYSKCSHFGYRNLSNNIAPKRQETMETLDEIEHNN